MASTFTLTSSSTYDGRIMKLSCSQTKDIATNKSTITWTLTTSGGRSNYYSTGPTNVWINGVHVYSCARKDWSTKAFPAAKGSVSGTIIVDHDAFGDAKIGVSLTTAIYQGSSSAKTDEATWTLDNIPRGSKPTLSEVNFYIGDKITINTNRVNNSFTHEIFIKHADGLYYSAVARDVTDSWVWDTGSAILRNSETLYDQCRERMCYYSDILLRTWNGNNIIGDKTVAFRTSVPSYEVSEPTNATVSVYNTNQVISQWNVAVKGFTKLQCSVTPGASKCSNYVQKYYLTLIAEQNDLSVPGTDVKQIYENNASSGDSTENFSTDVLSVAGTFCLKVSIEDSRGKIRDYIIRDPSDSTKPLKMTIYDYDTPKIQNATAFRCDSTGVAKDSGTYLSIGCVGVAGAGIGGRNGVSSVYQWRIVGGTYSAKVAIPASPISRFSVSNTFEVKFTVQDTIGNETTRIISIPLGVTDFNLTPLGAGFGMYHDHSEPNTLQSAWDLMIKGNKMTDFVVDTYSYTSSDITVYCRKWVSGNMECWASRRYTRLTVTTQSRSAFYMDLNDYLTLPQGWRFVTSHIEIPSISGGELIGVMTKAHYKDSGLLQLRLWSPSSIDGTGSWSIQCYLRGLWK